MDDLIKKALQDNTCPAHSVSYRHNPHFELYCNRCDWRMVITPDVKIAIDQLYTRFPIRSTAAGTDAYWEKCARRDLLKRYKELNGSKDQ